MLIVAALGLSDNLISMWLLANGKDLSFNVNVPGVGLGKFALHLRTTVERG